MKNYFGDKKCNGIKNEEIPGRRKNNTIHKILRRWFNGGNEIKKYQIILTSTIRSG